MSSKSVKIGTTAQNATASATADRESVEGLTFPRNLRVTNQMPIAIVFPELNLHLIGNTRVPKKGEVNSAAVKFANAAQLKRFEADAETLANIHKYKTAVLIEEISSGTPATNAAAPATISAEAPPAPVAPTVPTVSPKTEAPHQTEAAAATGAPVPAATEKPAGAQSRAA